MSVYEKNQAFSNSTTFSSKMIKHLVSYIISISAKNKDKIFILSRKIIKHSESYDHISLDNLNVRAISGLNLPYSLQIMNV